MVKKTLLLLPLLVIFMLFVLFNKASNKYEKVDFSRWNEEAKSHLKGKTEVDLLRNITRFVGSEGDFRGTIKQYRSGNQLIIEVHEDYIPDDSITSIDERYIAEKRNDAYEVIDLFQKVGH